MSLESPPVVVKERLGALTPLRFFASIGVLMSHSLFYFIQRPANWQAPEHLEWLKQILVYYHATPRVPFFFVLSGFVLYYAYGEIKKREFGSFLWKRAARILPVFLLSFVIVLGFELLDTQGWAKAERKMEPVGGPWPPVVASLFFLQAWIPIGGFNFAVNGPAWAVSVEVFFYLLFPLLAWKLRVNFWWKILLSLLPVLGLVQLAVHLDAPSIRGSNDPNVTLQSLIQFFPLARVLEFLVGMVLAIFFLKIRHLREFIPQWLATILELGALYFFLQANRFIAPLGAKLREWSSSWISHPEYHEMLFRWVDERCYLLSIVTAIFVFALGRGYISRLFQSSFFQAIGAMSFAIYLMHIPVRHLILHFFDEDSFFIGSDKIWAWNFWVYFLLVLIVAYVTRRFFELPAQQWLRKKMPARKG